MLQCCSGAPATRILPASGNPPRESSNPDGKRLVEDTLSVQGARYVNYDELLENAFQAYQDYLKKGKVVDRLGEVIKAIEDFGE